MVYVTSTSKCDVLILLVIYKVHVTLSHLRSKEFQRIHLPCIPQHRDAVECTTVKNEMLPGVVAALQKNKPLSSKQA